MLTQPVSPQSNDPHSVGWRFLLCPPMTRAIISQMTHLWPVLTVQQRIVVNIQWDTQASFVIAIYVNIGTRLLRPIPFWTWKIYMYFFYLVLIACLFVSGIVDFWYGFWTHWYEKLSLGGDKQPEKRRCKFMRWYYVLSARCFVLTS